MERSVYQVLLVEDDPADVDLAKEAFKSATSGFHFEVTDDGMKGLKYLRREAPYENASRPDLILLDINLPKKDGREVLREIKNDEQLRSIPLVVLTTSDSHRDLVSAYALDPRSYQIKPSTFSRYTSVVQSVEELLKGAAGTPASTTRHLLLVEDDPQDAETFKEMLNNDAGFDATLECIPRLQAAQQRLLEDPAPDLILLDLFLPDSNGVQTFLKMQTSAPGIPIVVLTGLDDESLALGAVRDGAQDYLVKGQIESKMIGRVMRHAIERHRMQEALRTLSLTDDLTGLHNRRGFTMLAAQQQKLARRTGTGLLLFFADVDGLKTINDQYGHREGDFALKKIAEILQESFRNSDTLARIGGDEFAIAAVEDRMESADALNTRLQEILERENRCSQLPYHLNLSVGMIRIDPQQTATLDEWLEKADQLLYKQKRRQKPPPSQD